MEKTKRLESLKDELFTNLPDDILARATGGILATTGGPPGPTHFAHQHDVEVSDPL